MENILMDLQTAIDRAEQEMRLIASNNIIQKQENSEQHSKTMETIKLISQIRGLLYRTEPSQTNRVALQTPLKGKHLRAIYIDDVRYPAKYMRDAARLVCETLLKSNSRDLQSCCNSLTTLTKGEMVISFSKNDLSCESPDRIVFGDKELYIDSCKLSINNMGLLRKLLNTIGFDESRISIEIDDQYLRKTRTTKQKKSS